MTLVLIIIAILAIIVVAVVLTPVGHAIRTQPRHLRPGGSPAPGRARAERPFRRPRGRAPRS
jgi:hypothetical protein